MMYGGSSATLFLACCGIFCIIDPGGDIQTSQLLGSYVVHRAASCPNWLWHTKASVFIVVLHDCTTQKFRLCAAVCSAQPLPSGFVLFCLDPPITFYAFFLPSLPAALVHAVDVGARSNRQHT